MYSWHKAGEGSGKQLVWILLSVVQCRKVVLDGLLLRNVLGKLVTKMCDNQLKRTIETQNKKYNGMRMTKEVTIFSDIVDILMAIKMLQEHQHNP